MNYSDFIDEVKEGMAYEGLGVYGEENKENNTKVEKELNDLISSGIVGDGFAENDDDEFDENDVADAVWNLKMDFNLNY
tara:strand:- start:158 stop:394 length:237 start_codon:yes stop_codon:yes gene_type:complete